MTLYEASCWSYADTHGGSLLAVSLSRISYVLSFGLSIGVRLSFTETVAARTKKEKPVLHEFISHRHLPPVMQDGLELPRNEIVLQSGTIGADGASSFWTLISLQTCFLVSDAYSRRCHRF